MTIDAAPRVKVPATAAPGEVITIRTLLSHPMESGFRLGEDGARVPRRIIARFLCTFEDETVLDVELEPAMAANPFFAFDVVASRSGTFRFRWIEDGGDAVEAEAALTVA